MNVILLGPPGCGKGTQGALLATRTETTRIATGDLLREAVRAGTDLGQKAQSFMDKGLLVPDEVILGLITEVLNTPEAQNGVIMDGFPRTVTQAEAVDELLASKGQTVDHVFTFEVPDAELVRRMQERAEQEGRSDDTPEAFQNRLGVYQEQTAPLIAFYEQRNLVTAIPGTGTKDEVAARVQGALQG